MPIKDGSSNIDVARWFNDLTWNEIHLLWMGLYAGFVAPQPKRKHEPSDFHKEQLKWDTNRWYYSMGYVVGYVLKVVVVGTTALEVSQVVNLLPA